MTEATRGIEMVARPDSLQVQVSLEDGGQGKARLIVIDLETYRSRNPQLVAQIEAEAIQKRPANNTLKELKTLWDTAEARAERAAEALGKTAVDPLLAEILCACWVAAYPTDDPLEPFLFETHRHDAMRNQYTCTASDQTRIGESSFGDWTQVLDHLAAELDEAAGPDTIWIGHNITGFDLPVLLNSWRRAGIKPPEHFPSFSGRWHGRVYDTMQRTPAKTPFVSLSAACEAYGLGPAKSGPGMMPGMPAGAEDAFDGSMVGATFEAGDYDRILDYCAHDVWVTLRLYMAMTHEDQWGTYDSRDAIARQVKEIEQADLSEAAKAIAIVNLLSANGLVPRCA